MGNFSYLVFCPASGRGLGVDPSFAPENLLAAAAERGVTIDILVNTHGHRDHIAGNGHILEATGARLAAHPLDVASADIPLTEGSVLKVGEGTVEILHTPGHTPGSLTGDTLFVTCVGRADLAGSDPAALYRSLCRLAAFPPATRIYPGHDYGPRPVSSVAFEREHNPYLQCADLESFLRLRMG
jgi:glyoxylase-like metal-dependent hydrolase (beta-lactamase superfamily II)